MNADKMKQVKAVDLASPVVIFGGGKGGIGKSFHAQTALSARLMSGVKHPLIIQIEAEDRFGKLFGISNQYVYVPIAKDVLAELAVRPQKIYRAFDAMMRSIAEARSKGQEVIIDCAANADHALSNYLLDQGEDSVLGTGDRVTFIAVTSGDPDAMVAAGNAVLMMRDALPDVTAEVIFNNADPSSDREHDDPVFRKFEKKAMEIGARSVVYVDRIPAPTLLRAMKDIPISLPSSVTMRKSDWVELHISAEEANRELRVLARYLKTMQSEFDRMLG
jgi:hypothetical protein